MKDFAGKVVFITGGASGAGLGQAQLFAEAGCKIVIADLRQDHLDDALAFFQGRGVKIHAIKLDVTDRKAFTRAADEIEAIFGEPPQLLFNTAGVNTFGPAEASTYEDFDWVMGVCLGGVINGMVTFVPRMIKAGKGGHIVVTSSFGGFGGGATTAPYSAAKAAVNNLMESYSLSLKPYGIGVTILCPMNIKSNIAEATYTRPKHLAATGYKTDEDTIKFLRSMHAHGMDPLELARWLKRGIENDQLYVIPYENSAQLLKDNFERILDLASPGGVKRQEELLKNRPKPYDAGDSGFGKAKTELFWVDESVRARNNK